MHIWTDNPQKEIWAQLRYLKSPSNMQNLLSGTIKSRRPKLALSKGELEQTSLEISSCIDQGDQYFHASQTVDLATKPLLLFYGAQSLSKALILANGNDVSLKDIRYHGLHTHPKTKKQQDYVEKPDSWNLEDEFAITNEGTFQQLVKVTDFTELKLSQELKLKDLFRHIPELSSLYYRHYGQLSNVLNIYMDPHKEKDGCLSIVFYENDRDLINQFFPKNNYEEIEKHKKIGVRSRIPIDFFPPLLGRVVNGSVGGRYFVKPYNGFANPISVMYSTLFILSNIVRYKPAFWTKTLVGVNTGSASLVEFFCNLAERRFPCDVLSEIWNEAFSFGQPGYFS